MIYQQIVGFLWAQTVLHSYIVADLFLYRYERGSMSNIHKSKLYDLIDYV